MVRVVDLGYQFVNVGGIDVNRPKGSGDFLFLYFRCPTEVWRGNAYQTIPEGTYYLYKKGEPQRYRRLHANYINDWIHFDIEPYNDYFETLGIPFQTPMRLADSKPVSEMISDLFIEYFDVGRQHEVILEQKANALFHKFSDLYHLSENNGGRKLKYRMRLLEMRKQIQNFEDCPRNAGEMAKQLNISTSYLQHLYKQFFGVSLNQDIIHSRVEHAAHLLHGTGYSIAEVAAMCGYENLEHFSRQFKKVKGCSPSSYRK